MKSLLRSAVFALGLLLPAAASAQDSPWLLPAFGDTVFKGVVGKALDVVPMDPDHRVTLQRGNAVFSNTLTGRSLAVWAGLTNPLLLIGGLAWGIFAASNIKAEVISRSDPRADPFTCIETGHEQLTRLHPLLPERLLPAGYSKDHW